MLFRGNVQGVGFRYTASRAACGYDLTGSVRNLPDGSVELIVEGTPREIDMFLADIQQRMGRFIRTATRSDSPATGEFAGFGVAY